MNPTYRQALAQLRGAQKPAARSAPAYSRFVNRRWGRYLAAGAASRGLSPDAVTGISALCTFSGIAVLALVPISVGSGVLVAFLLALGYAFDSADGQVARLQGRSSTAGEWLDHVVDAAKSVILPLGLGVALWRSDAVDDRWVVLPLVSTVVTSVLFFAMILTEQLRRVHGVRSRADVDPGSRSWVRALLVIPMDYGVLCWSFVLLGFLPVFLGVYTVITAASGLFLLLAAAKWYRELAALDAVRATAGASQTAVPPGASGSPSAEQVPA
ncbi:CDP-alcohol phosphatidyltransferase family protein [Cellulomonas sp.]|uniref:CDP-alcohol phosphatidyltransferase family protein n=1 Tax=Cellulomonas sp. TaxID=40001 RepID=UPI001B07B0F9|nr:CDP-alcohol phosphatidyltransferase family protein [Cellulomonas sp.]MBO9553269.1 CDP-alcohol phosphatidyltransferase family protein [Cellulomonas sp.]